MMNRYEVWGRLVEKIVKEYKKAWDNRGGERGEYYDLAPINRYRDPMKDIEEEYDKLFLDLEEESKKDEGWIRIHWKDGVIKVKDLSPEEAKKLREILKKVEE